ncbi:MAG: hypothetical protein PWP24_423 [Clostridiales bacterium]|nr:hypothetical protein [Clostridiales bacterium]
MDYESRGTSLAWKKKLLFAGIFIQENRLHAVFDRYNELSCKKWLLMSVCKAFETPPDLSTLAKQMGCSRQNVKKLALSLEKEGFLQFEKSGLDARSLCIRITEKGERLNERNEQLGADVHAAIFQEFSEEEIALYYDLSVKMMHGIAHLEEYFKEREGERYDKD